jgi:putative transposase
MYYMIKPCFMGRDKFIEVMMELGFRLKYRRNYRRTTYAGKVVYPNLIKGMTVSSPSTIWQSDITYLPVGDKVYYAVFIIDVYSKKIVGYKVSDSMRARANYEALAMALSVNPAPMIHHSDRGSQYSSIEYTRALQDNGCKISMGLTAQDNAYAERINGTIKDEYLDHWKPSSYEQLKQLVRKAVNNYNHCRSHNHLGRLNPIVFETKWYTDPGFERPTITIFDDNNI